MLRSTLSLMYRARVALLLGVVVCLSAGRAEACGEAFFKVAYANPNGANQSMVPHQGEHSAPGAPGDRPCHGPNCSGSPTPNTPPVSSVPASSSTAKETARQLANDSDDCDSQRSLFTRDTTSRRPINRASSVFHPPRLG